MKDRRIKRKTTTNNPKRSLRFTKILALFLLLVFFNSTAGLYSQEKGITIKLKNTPLKNVFDEIEKKSNYIFLLSGNLGNELERKVTVDARSKPIEDILNSVIAKTDLKYEIVDRQVIIYKKTEPLTTDPRRRIETEQQHPGGRLLVEGLIADEEGIPLIGVNVVAENTTIGTVTDEKGRFSIAVPVNATLCFTYIGYITQKNLITEQIFLDIRMKEDVQALDDVVITGYAPVRKESFTGSITQIKKEDLLRVSTGNIVNAIQAFDPSFRLMDNLSAGSNPNVLPEFYMRGQSGLPGVKELDMLQSSDVSQFSLKTNPNTPIFILDGFEVGVEKIFDLDLTRISSITLLKDASSSAIYGSRAANGVVVIETVRPKPGQFRVNYSGNYAYTAPDLSSYNLMNAAEKIQAEKDANFFGEPEPWEYNFDKNFYEMKKMKKRASYIRKQNQILQGVDTYWLSQPLKSALNHKHALFVEGGNESLRYGVELQYDKQDGVMKESFRNKKGIGLVAEYNHKTLQIRNHINFNAMSSQNSPYGDFGNYLRLQPYYAPFDWETGDLMKKYEFHDDSRNVLNPLYEATLGNSDKGGYKEWVNNLSLNWQITRQLLVKGQYAITYNDASTNTFISPESTRYSAAQDEPLKRGELQTSETKSINHNVNLFAAYNQAFSNHHINLSLGFNVAAGDFNHVRSFYRGFPGKNFSSPAYAAEIVEKPRFSDNKTRLFGTFFTSNYSYKNIYLIDTSIRVDGSSEFGADRKWAPFWSFGAGLNIHNYPIFAENKLLTQLRITANTGQTGKSNFTPFMANNTFEIFNGDWYPTGIGAGLIYLGNRALSWEKTISNNIALDVTLMNRHSLRLDVYRKTTHDLISDVSLPTSSGFTVYKDNVGEILNHGFEVKLNLGIITSRDMNLFLFGNLAHNKNRINKISESLKRYNERIDKYYEDYKTPINQLDEIFIQPENAKFSKPLKKFEEGKSITAIYGMKSLGINPANGKEVFVKKDGTITYDWNSAEQQVIGNTEPWAQGSFGLNAQYKKWSLYTTFLYEFGGERYNQTLVSEVENVDLLNSNADKRVATDRWIKPGDITPLKDIKEGLIITRPTSRFVQKNNFVRFNSVSLGYDFDKEIANRLGLNMLRLQFNMNDIALFSTIRREMGTSYPFARTFTFTLNLAL